MTNMTEYIHFISNFTIFLSIGLWVFMIGCSISAILLARFRFRSSLRINELETPQIKEGPYVSVLRPLAGEEYKLRENLESSFKQDYPNFELIFSVTDVDDNAIPIVKSLIAQYPHIDAKLVIDPSLPGINPKVNNLIEAYSQSKHNIVWVCDSNIMLNLSCLSRSVELLQDEKVGLVHHLPIGVSCKAFGAQLDAAFLNTAHAKMYSVINFVNVAPCIVGKSCLYRKSDLEDKGGIAAFTDLLAEDHLIGQAIWDKGLRHCMTSDLVYNRLGDLSTKAYFGRRARWARLRKSIVPAATIIEPFTESILNGVFVSYGLSSLLHVHPLNFLAFHLVLWFLLDLQLVKELTGRSLHGVSLRQFIVSWTIRELSALPLYIYAMLGNRFEWRGKAFRITMGSKVRPEMEGERGILHPLFHNMYIEAFAKGLFDTIDWLADILIMSQRNGNPQDPSDLEHVVDSPFLQPIKGYNTFNNSDLTQKPSEGSSSIIQGQDNLDKFDNLPLPMI